MSDQNKFVQGIRVFEPNKDWVKADIKINKEELRHWLDTAIIDAAGLDKNGNIKAQIKVSKKGPWYMEVNTWQPQGEQAAKTFARPSSPQSDAMNDLEDDIPF